jgi:hypothetical protein
MTRLTNPLLRRVRRLVSGGQTGVDRAALDVAARLGMQAGGWCPAGRWAEDGRIPDAYKLVETRSAFPIERTRRNVLETDATLVIARRRLDAGTRATLRLARALHRQCLHLSVGRGPGDRAALARARGWIVARRIRTLKVAGPRESADPGIYLAARAFLLRLFDRAQLASLTHASGSADRK